jgi:hypothetical protein
MDWTRGQAENYDSGEIARDAARLVGRHFVIRCVARAALARQGACLLRHGSGADRVHGHAGELGRAGDRRRPGGQPPSLSSTRSMPASSAAPVIAELELDQAGELSRAGDRRARARPGACRRARPRRRSSPTWWPAAELEQEHAGRAWPRRATAADLVASRRSSTRSTAANLTRSPNQRATN